MIASAGINLKFNYWPLKGGELIYAPPVTSPVTSISWSKDNGYLTFLPLKGTPEIVSIKDNKIKTVHSIIAFNDVTALLFLRTTKKSLGIGTGTGTVALYDTKSKTVSKLFDRVSSQVSFIDFNVHDEIMGVACKSGLVVLYHVGTGKVTGSVNISNICSPTAFQFHPTEPHLLSAATQDGTVTMWDLKTWKKIFYAQTHVDAITGVAAAAGSDLLVTVGYDSKFCVHDLNINECVFRSNVQQPLTAVDVSSDGVSIAIGASSGVVYIYDIRQLLQPVTSWDAHSTPVNKVLFENRVKESTGFIEDSISEVSSVCGAESPKIKHKTKTFKRVTDANETKPKLNPSKAVKLVENIKTADIVNLKSIKDEVIETMRTDAIEVQNQMIEHFTNLGSFLKNEFHTIDSQMDDRWDMLNMAIPKENDISASQHQMNLSSEQLE